MLGCCNAFNADVMVALLGKLPFPLTYINHCGPLQLFGSLLRWPPPHPLLGTLFGTSLGMGHSSKIPNISVGLGLVWKWTWPICSLGHKGTTLWLPTNYICRNYTNVYFFKYILAYVWGYKLVYIKRQSSKKNSIRF